MAHKESLQFTVVTQEKTVYSKTADSVTAKTALGEITILPHHDNLVTLIEPGEIKIHNGSERIALATSGGFLEVNNNVVTILADSAELPSDINIEEAEKARQEALAVMQGKADTLTFDEALKALEYARTRLKVAKEK